MSTNVVALFDTQNEAQAAVRRLLDAGLASSRISVLGKGEGSNDWNSQAVDGEGNLAAEGAASGITSGTVVGAGIGLLAGLGLGVAVPFLGFLVAGPIAGLITGAAAGAATGGVLGGLIGLGIPKEDAEYYAAGIEGGGTLVVAEADEADVDRFEDILRGAGGTNVHEDDTQSNRTNYMGDDPSYAPASTDATYAANAGTVADPALNSYADTTASSPAPTPAPANAGYATTANSAEGTYETPNDDRYRVRRFGSGTPSNTIGDSYTESFDKGDLEYGSGLFSDERFRGMEYGSFENTARTEYEARYPERSWETARAGIRSGYDRAKGNYAYADRDNG